MHKNNLKHRLTAILLSLVLFLLSPGIAVAENSTDMSRFTDVIPGQWYYAAIEFVVTNGYFKGVSETSFAPAQPMTRAMFVTALGRMAGVDPKAEPQARFKDVESNSYYIGYVAWASKNGIVQGLSNDLFSPDAFVTREQVAVFLYRYAQYIGMDVSIGQTAVPHSSNNSTFNGENIISPWAMTAMSWASSRGILRGTDKGLEPQTEATRAQVAQMLYSFSLLTKN